MDDKVVSQILGIVFIVGLAIWIVWDRTRPAPPRVETPALDALYKTERYRAAQRRDASGCFVLLLLLIGAGGMLWAAFAIHPGLGIAALAFGVLALIAAAQ